MEPEIVQVPRADYDKLNAIIAGLAEGMRQSGVTGTNAAKKFFADALLLPQTEYLGEALRGSLNAFAALPLFAGLVDGGDYSNIPLAVTEAMNNGDAEVTEPGITEEEAAELTKDARDFFLRSLPKSSEAERPRPQRVLPVFIAKNLFDNIYSAIAENDELSLRAAVQGIEDSLSTYGKNYDESVSQVRRAVKQMEQTDDADFMWTEILQPLISSGYMSLKDVRTSPPSRYQGTTPQDAFKVISGLELKLAIRSMLGDFYSSSVNVNSVLTSLANLCTKYGDRDAARYFGALSETEVSATRMSQLAKDIIEWIEVGITSMTPDGSGVPCSSETVYLDPPNPKKGLDGKKVTTKLVYTPVTFNWGTRPALKKKQLQGLSQQETDFALKKQKHLFLMGFRLKKRTDKRHFLSAMQTYFNAIVELSKYMEKHATRKDYTLVSNVDGRKVIVRRKDIANHKAIYSKILRNSIYYDEAFGNKLVRNYMPFPTEDRKREIKAKDIVYYANNNVVEWMNTETFYLYDPESGDLVDVSPEDFFNYVAGECAKQIESYARIVDAVASLTRRRGVTFAQLGIYYADVFKHLAMLSFQHPKGKQKGISYYVPTPALTKLLSSAPEYIKIEVKGTPSKLHIINPDRSTVVEIINARTTAKRSAKTEAIINEKQSSTVFKADQVYYTNLSAVSSSMSVPVSFKETADSTKTLTSEPFEGREGEVLAKIVARSASETVATDGFTYGQINEALKEEYNIITLIWNSVKSHKDKVALQEKRKKRSDQGISRRRDKKEEDDAYAQETAIV